MCDTIEKTILLEGAHWNHFDHPSFSKHIGLIVTGFYLSTLPPRAMPEPNKIHTVLTEFSGEG